MTTATGAPIASDNQQNPPNSCALLGPLKRPIVRDFAFFTALLLINLYCFHRTMNGYFLADDFVHVPYLVKVFNGHADLLIQNFYTNWVQAQGTQFYRPFISLTLALDYLFWKANPVGYHITNFLYQVASSILLFLCTRRLFKYKSTAEAQTVGFLAGAFFAACPLHAEVVSWIIARVDSVQTTFLLASLWMYLRARDQVNPTASKVISFSCFVVALMSKEMAITLPPTLVLLEMMKSEKASLIDRVKDAVKATWQYWLLFAIYMGVRTAALGTISGGYAGSIGQGLSSSLYKRFFQDGSFFRVLLPLNTELPGGAARRLVSSLKLFYELAGVLTLARMIFLFKEGTLAAYMRQLAFAGGWFVIAMLPTYQVWNLTETLQGSRFIYLGTAPLSLLAALLVAPVHFENQCRVKKFLNFVSAITAFLLIWTCMQITYQNNSAWAQASKGVRAFRAAIEQWFTPADAKSKTAIANHAIAGRKLVVLNIPQKFAGAHMIYNAATLSVLLRPPLSPSDYADRVVTFEPITFGSADLINVARLRRMIDRPAQYQFVKWDSIKQKLVPLNLVSGKIDRKLTGSEATDSRSAGNESFLVSPTIDLPAVSVDFVDVKVKNDKQSDPTDVITMSWNTVSDPIFRNDRTLSKAVENSRHIQFAVSEHKNWVSSETIHQLKFELPHGMNIEEISLYSGESSIPTISPNTSTPSTNGRTVAEDVGGVSRPGDNIGPFTYDISNIPGADHAVVEVSNTDSWFEHYTGTFRDQKLSPEHFVAKELKGKSGDFTFPAKQLERPGFYEIRVCAVDKNGKLLGFTSDPINLQFSAADIRK